MFNFLSGSALEGMAPGLDFAVYSLGLLFVLVIVLWLFRRFAAGTFIAGGIHRHRRLAILDAAAVDTKRRLVLVRRDDREHLLLIGGSTDIVVEQNIEHPPEMQTKGGKPGEPATESAPAPLPATTKAPSSRASETGRQAAPPAASQPGATAANPQKASTTETGATAAVNTRNVSGESARPASPQPSRETRYAHSAPQGTERGPVRSAATDHVRKVPENETIARTGRADADLSVVPVRGTGGEYAKSGPENAKPAKPEPQNAGSAEKSAKPQALEDEMERLLQELSSGR